MRKEEKKDCFIKYTGKRPIVSFGRPEARIIFDKENNHTQALTSSQAGKLMSDNPGQYLPVISPIDKERMLEFEKDKGKTAAALAENDALRSQIEDLKESIERLRSRNKKEKK